MTRPKPKPIPTRECPGCHGHGYRVSYGVRPPGGKMQVGGVRTVCARCNGRKVVAK